MRSSAHLALPFALSSSLALAGETPPDPGYKLRVTPLLVKRVDYSLRHAKLDGAAGRVARRLANLALRLAESPGGSSEAQIPDDHTTMLKASSGGMSVEFELKRMNRGTGRTEYVGFRGTITHERKSASRDIRRFERTLYLDDKGKVQSQGSYDRSVEEDEGEITKLMPTATSWKQLK